MKHGYLSNLLNSITFIWLRMSYMLVQLITWTCLLVVETIIEMYICFKCVVHSIIQAPVLNGNDISALLVCYILVTFLTGYLCFFTFLNDMLEELNKWKKNEPVFVVPSHGEWHKRTHELSVSTSQCIVPQTFNLLPFLYYSFVRVVRFFTNMQNAVFCINLVRWSPDKNIHNLIHWIKIDYVR